MRTTASPPSQTCAGASTTCSPEAQPSGIEASIPRKSLRGEFLRQVAPEAHQQEVEAGYLKGLVEEAPAAITLNMRAACTRLLCPRGPHS